MADAIIGAAVGEFQALCGTDDPLKNAVFLWCLWKRLARNQDTVSYFERMLTEDFERLFDADPPGTDHFLDNIHVHHEKKLLRYLAKRTVIAQRIAAGLVSPTLHSRKSRIETINGLEMIANVYYLIRRGHIKDAPVSFEIHRRFPRCFFPDLRIIPTKINDNIEVDLVPLEKTGRKLAGDLRLLPKIFTSPAKYDVITQQFGRDTLLRFSRLSEGADERLQQMKEVLRLEREAAVPGRCVMFWPELSVDEQIALDFVSYLSSSSASGHQEIVRMVMPGTFSVESQKTRQEISEDQRSPHAPNRAMLLNADTGEEIITQDKIKAFVSEKSEGRVIESIDPSRVLTVCRSDWGTFCILICRDAVDFKASISKWLDVDYILVPSMGEPNTKRAWGTMAQHLSQGWGGRSALALQSPPKLPDWKHIPDPDTDSTEIHPRLDERPMEKRL